MHKKLDIANLILGLGDLFVHLDPRREGVMVPPWLRHQAQLVLQVGFNMPIEIPDLKVDETGISGTLSFSRTPFLCVLPWSTIFALVAADGSGRVWDEDMPAEIANQVAEHIAAKKNKNPPGIGHISEAKAKRPGPTTKATAAAKGKRKPLPPYLRVVK